MRKFITAILALFICVFAFAHENVTYSGYSIDRLICNTGKLFVNKQLLDPDSRITFEWRKYQLEAEEQRLNEMLAVFPFMDFEQFFINYCVGQNLITRNMALAALDKSQKCGGLTINGYNLLILHTAILADLVSRKVITVREAQNILDSSKKED